MSADGQGTKRRGNIAENYNRLSRVHERYRQTTDRQTDRQTDGRQHIFELPIQPGTERVQAFADISRSAVCCHSNKTRAPIANPPISAQLEGTAYHSRIYIRVRAVVWECGNGHRQTHRHADGRGQCIFRLGYGLREM